MAGSGADERERRRRRQYWLPQAVALGILSVFFCWAFMASPFTRGIFRSPSLKELSRALQIEFPESARLLKGKLLGMVGYTIYAKIEMDRADIDSFIASLPGSLSVSRGQRPDMDEQHAQWEWWDPSSARDFVSIVGEYQLPGCTYPNRLRILIAMDDPERAVVYLYCIGGD